MKTGMNVLVLDKDCVCLTVYFCRLSYLSGVCLAELQILLLFCGFFLIENL